MRVDATCREGEAIGHIQFALVGVDGEVIDFMGDSDNAHDPVSVKLVQAEMHHSWQGRGVAERVKIMVGDEISVSPANDP